MTLGGAQIVVIGVEVIIGIVEVTVGVYVSRLARELEHELDEAQHRKVFGSHPPRPIATKST